MAIELLKTCWKKGITLSLVDDNLSFKAAEGVMTPEVLANIKENKKTLIELLTVETHYYDARPLSENEKALWFLYRLKPESVAYNMAYAVKLTSYYRHEQIEKAFVDLCKAYPILALNYGDREGEPLQWLTEYKPVKVMYDTKYQQSHSQLDTWLQQQADTALMPDKNKTCHVALLHHHTLLTKEKKTEEVKEAKEENNNEEKQTQSEQAAPTQSPSLATNNIECYLTIVVHHIAADFISFEILRRDFMRLLNGQSLSTREYPTHSYQTWAHQQYNSEHLAAEKYWIDSLQDLPQLQLPTDFNFQDNLPSVGAELQQTLSPELSEKVRYFCREQNITPYVWWLGAFQWFMSRLSGQSKFIIGTPSAGRLTPEDIELVGYLVNPLALHCDISSTQTFNDWLKTIKVKSQQMLSNQAYPFARLIEKVNLDRSSTRNPVFQHMFTLNSGTEDLLTNKLVEQELLAEQRGAAHELNLVVLDERNAFTCKWRYNKGLYKKETVLTIQQMFNYWVLQLIDDATQSINQLETAPYALQSTTNGPTLKPIAPTAWQAFENQVKGSSQQLAISHKKLVYTYETFYQKIEQLACTLAKKGFIQGDRLGIALPRSIEQVMAMFACWRLGGSFLVIDNDWPQSRVEYIDQDAQLTLMLCEQTLINEQLDQGNANTRHWVSTAALFPTKVDSLSFATQLPSVIIAPQDEAYLIYTSGSTGQPKAVSVTQRNITNYVSGLLHEVSLSANATMTSLSKHSADLGYTALFGALLTGRQFVVIEESLALDSQALLLALKKFPIDCLKIVPSHLNGLLLAEQDRALLPQQALIFGGETLTAHVINTVKKYDALLPVYNHYGPTETTIGAIIHPIKYASVDAFVDSQQDVPLGKPLANCDIKIIDKSGHVQALGLPGELHIAGPSVSQGYTNQCKHDKNITHEKFYLEQDKTWYRTGDKAIISQGNVFYRGRLDDQIKIRGYRVELGEIELWIKQHIDQVSVVVSQQSDSLNEKSPTRIIAVVVADEKALERVKNEIKNALPEYMVPANWISLEEMPRLANGKIDKKTLQNLSTEASTPVKSQAQVSSALHTRMEQQLLDIWCALLNKTDLSIEDDFFSAGGDSILGLQVIAKARSVNISIKPQQLFKYKTIRALVSAILPRQSKEELALLDIVRTLLNNPNINAHDDFFAVGGDSILSLQLVAKARKVNIQLSPKTIFEQKTIANLANTLAINTHTTGHIAQLVAQSIPEDAFPLTPIQSWFFKQDLNDPSHWNQSILLTVKTTLNMSVFTQATEVLLQQHASLRLAFIQLNNTWQQRYQAYQSDWLTQVVHCSEKPATEEEMNKYQGQFNLTCAPLLRLVYFPQDKTLLCTAHHLIVDAVSWQIMIEDLLSVYDGIIQGKPSKLLPINTEFFQWQAYLERVSIKKSIEKQSQYWLSQLMSQSASIESSSNNSNNSNNNYGESVHQVSTFDLTTTANLTKAANKAYHTKTQELLITALVKTLLSHWQLNEITIELEGHGRETNLFSTEKPEEALDLSRTIGWFTSRFPQKFTANGSLESCIVNQKEQLRNIPNNGVTYGLLRYLNNDETSQWGESNVVSFNYLGRRNTTIHDDFSVNEGLVMGTRARNNPRAHLLDINIMITNEKLHIDWCYAKSHSKFANIDQLIETFSVNLLDIITHCITPNSGRATATDFPLANITDESFVALLEELMMPASSTTLFNPLEQLNPLEKQNSIG
jgi:amino acid adenylation domain-containing protein/non-ribosomal peptide synthase protein (TIGR01720 family)